MTSFTIQGGRNVNRVFAGRFAAVMATGTVGGRSKAAVIHIVGRQPGRRFMTTVA